jgi:hypothetical protein
MKSIPISAPYTPAIGDKVIADGHRSLFFVEEVNEKERSARLRADRISAEQYLTNPIPWAHIHLFIKR